MRNKHFIDTTKLAHMSGGVLLQHQLMNGEHQVPEESFPKIAQGFNSSAVVSGGSIRPVPHPIQQKQPFLQSNLNGANGKEDLKSETQIEDLCEE